MNEILGWPPIIWTARVLLITLMGSATWIILVLVYVFSARAMPGKPQRADLPKLDEAGGANLRDMMAGLTERERLRRETLLALLTAEGVHVRDAHLLDSGALRRLLDQHYSKAA